MKYVLMTLTVLFWSTAANATELSANDLRYCEFLQLDTVYVEFIAQNPRTDEHDRLRSIPFSVLDHEQRLFEKGHVVWTALRVAGYLPFTAPYRKPDCD